MTPQIDINELYRGFWEMRKIRITALLKKPCLVAIVARRETDKARFVKLATSDAARIERIRNLRSLECELENAAEEIASLPLVESQRTRSRRPRGKVTEDGKTLNEVIGILVRRPEHLLLSAPELWPQFLGELDRLLLNPEELIHPTDPRKTGYSYDFKDKRKKITYGRFAHLVSEYRKKSR